jgi:hypothetical protein
MKGGFIPGAATGALNTSRSLHASHGFRTQLGDRFELPNAFLQALTTELPLPAEAWSLSASSAWRNSAQATGTAARPMSVGIHDGIRFRGLNQNH